jgi:membrane protein DedA with SNARE-associated domain
VTQPRPGRRSAHPPDPDPGGGRRQPSRLTRALAVSALLVPQAVLVAVQGAAPLLLREAPLLLLALHPFAPWSLLVATRTDLVVFLAVVVSVRTVPCLGGYLVGGWYGPQALDRLSRRPRSRRATAVVQRLSTRFGGALLIFYPGATASVLAGANAMPVRRFLPLMVTGLVLAALLARVLVSAAAGPLTAVAAAVDRYAVPVGLVLLAAVVLAQLRPGRRGPGRPAGS